MKSGSVFCLRYWASRSRIERSVAARAACYSRMIFVAACVMSDELQGFARAVQREKGADHSAAHPLDHHLQRPLHLAGTG